MFITVQLGMSLKKTFGRLKCRWRRLLKKMDLRAETAPTIIAAALVLHNICERSTICRYSNAWDYDTDPELRRQIQLLPQPEQRILDDPAGSSGVECHDAIRDWLAVHRPLLKSTW